MSYTKPEVFVLGEAVRLIESIGGPTGDAGIGEPEHED